MERKALLHYIKEQRQRLQDYEAQMNRLKSDINIIKDNLYRARLEFKVMTNRNKMKKQKQMWKNYETKVLKGGKH